MGDHPFEFIFGAPTPEQLEEHKRRHDQAHMEQQSLRHEVASYIDDLSMEQLKIFRAIISAVSGDEGYGQYMMGQLTAMLHVKYGLCVACGLNHDEELQRTLDAPVPLPVVEADEPMSDEERAINMHDYNLRAPNPGEVDARSDERPVICRGCGMLYQSLEDRMLRPTGIDGCHGCQLKSAHG